MAPRRSSSALAATLVASVSPLLLLLAPPLGGEVGFVPTGVAQQAPTQEGRTAWGLRSVQAPPRARTAVRAGVATDTAAGPVAASTVRQPAETYYALVEKGVANAKKPIIKTLHQSIVSGCYVGFAGLLSLSIAGNLGAAATVAPGLQKMVFAALFPVNLLLILNSGGQLFTGNTATVPMALFEGRVGMQDLVKSWGVSILGNIIGCGLFACAAQYAGLLVGGAQQLAVTMTTLKTSMPFGQALVKAIMCNWMVCMAVFLSEAARDLGGKMVGIWFPISAFVAMSMEHSVANMFLLPAGILSGAPVTIAKMVLKNWIPVAIGNAIAGTVCVAASYSYAFGALGKN